MDLIEVCVFFCLHDNLKTIANICFLLVGDHCSAQQMLVGTSSTVISLM